MTDTVNSFTKLADMTPHSAGLSSNWLRNSGVSRLHIPHYTTTSFRSIRSLKTAPQASGRNFKAAHSHTRRRGRHHDASRHSSRHRSRRKLNGLYGRNAQRSTTWPGNTQQETRRNYPQTVKNSVSNPSPLRLVHQLTRARHPPEARTPQAVRSVRKATRE